MKRSLSFLLAIFCMLPVFAQDIDSIIKSKPNRLVNDYVSALSKEEQHKLETKLVSFNNTTSTQIAVVVINELKGRKLEETATELFNTWGIGQRDKNNGLLILAVMYERKIRIEVGRGLESVVTNDAAARIIKEDIVPAFKESKYYEGFNKATSSLMMLAVQAFPETITSASTGTNDQTPVPGRNDIQPLTHYTAERYQAVSEWDWPEIDWSLVFIIILLLILAIAIKRILSKKNTGGVFGSNGYFPVQSKGGPFLGGFQAGWIFSNIFHNHPVNAAMFYEYKQNHRRAFRFSSGRNYNMGAWSTGGGGGNSNSSGSVTFGGGSSSGGGASGSW